MDRKGEIINTATSLFKEKGYTTVTMREIAAEIGVKVATLYSHINSKQEILSIIALNVADTFTINTRDINILEENAIQKLKQIINLYIDITFEHPERMEMLEINWIYLEGENLDYYKKLRLDFEHSLKSVIEGGINSGVLRNANAEIMLNFLLYTLRSVTKWYPYKKNIDQKLLKKDLLTLLITALEK